MTICGTITSGTIIASTDGITVTFQDNPQPIPEFQTTLIFPIFVIATLLTVIIYKRNARAGIAI